MNITQAEACRKLVNHAVSTGDWSWREGRDEDGQFIALHHPCMGQQAVHVRPDAAVNNDPETILKAAKDGRDVSHLTRVVGYFSKLENWNPSKYGELKDRQEGDYSV